MNRYMRDRIMGRDGRRGVPGSGRRDRGRYDDEVYMDEYPRRRRDSMYEEREEPRGGKGYERGGQSYRPDRNYQRDMRYDDYDDYHDFEYNYDMHDQPLELKPEDIRKWEKDVKNADGSRGAKFSRDQVIPIARQLGIQFDKFTEDEFLMAVNMMYSDYCTALQDASFPNYMRPEPYIHMAKAFLCDKDFDGKPYEKLAIYYYEISEYEE